MRAQSAMLGAVALARLLYRHHRLEFLADEIIGIELLIFGKPDIQARLEHVPSLRADLHAVLTARCRDSEPMRTWPHEWLLGRPQKKDRLLGGRRDVQGTGGSHLLRLALLGQTLRGEGQPWGIAGPEEEARSRPEARREGEEALGGGPQGAPLRHPKGALRVRGGSHGALGESLHDVPRYSPHRSHQEKGGRSATQRDAFLRAAWRVMVAAVVEPARLLFVDECGTHTSLAPIYGYAPKGERLRLSVPRRRGKNTTLLASMSLEGMGPSLAVEG